MVARWELVDDLCTAEGLMRYETSNWAREGEESRHNLKYWKREPVVALGVSAASFDGVTRRTNSGSIPAYLPSPWKGRDGLRLGGDASGGRRPAGARAPRPSDGRRRAGDGLRGGCGDPAGHRPSPPGRRLRGRPPGPCGRAREADSFRGPPVERGLLGPALRIRAGRGQSCLARRRRRGPPRGAPERRRPPRRAAFVDLEGSGGRMPPRPSLEEERRQDERDRREELDQDVQRRAGGVLERVADRVADDGGLVRSERFRDPCRRRRTRRSRCTSWRCPRRRRRC